MIGWAAVCKFGVVVARSQDGGTNVNAEMFAIRDLLNNLYSYRRKWLENDPVVEVVTDSKTAIQIITGYMSYPDEYNVKASKNYEAAATIVSTIFAMKKMGVDVKFTHVRGHQENIGNNFADYAAQNESNRLYAELYGGK